MDHLVPLGTVKLSHNQSFHHSITHTVIIKIVQNLEMTVYDRFHGVHLGTKVRKS